MSRVAKMPIALPKGVECTVGKDAVTVKGPKGTLMFTTPEGVEIGVQGSEVQCKTTSTGSTKMAGTARALIANMAGQDGRLPTRQVIGEYSGQEPSKTAPRQVDPQPHRQAQCAAPHRASQRSAHLRPGHFGRRRQGDRGRFDGAEGSGQGSE